MFAKQKQSVEKQNSSSPENFSADDPNLNSILEEKKMSQNDDIVMPPRVKSPPSLLSTDLFVKGNLNTAGDIQIEGTVEGNIIANLLTVGQNATIKGEIMAEEVVVNGAISGTIKGNRVHLTTSAKVDGDIIHNSIAIDSGAHFEGSIEKSENPLSKVSSKGPVALS